MRRMRHTEVNCGNDVGKCGSGGDFGDYFYVECFGHLSIIRV